MINKINNILLLDSFRSCIERRSRDFLSKRDLSVSSLFQDKTPFRLFSGGPKKFEDDESALQGVTRTFGICSSMLIYNVACEAIFTQGIPVEKVASVGLFLFPWWSSSYFAEWRCFDFFCSSIDKFQGVKSLPYEEIPEIRTVKSTNKKSYFFCLTLLFCTYAYIYSIRVSVTEILVERHKETFDLLFQKTLQEGDHLFEAKYEES